MKPSYKGLILEGSRDRRYARKGARLVESPETVEYIKAETDRVYSRLYGQALRSVTDSDITSAQFMAIAMKQTWKLFDDDHLSEDIASKRANEDLACASIVIGDTNHTLIIIRGLEAIVALNREEAMLNLVRRPVAEEMLSDYSSALLR